MFTNYLDIVGYNAEPVLLSYPHQNEIDTLINIISAKRPEYEFSTTDRIKHELWILNEIETTEVTNAFKKIDACYIADGHHRSASSAALTKLRKENGNSELNNKDFFLAFFIDERKLKIVEFNRIVKSLNGLSKNEFLDKLNVSFEIEKLHKQHKPTPHHL